jgi:hypothetical protein
MTLRAGSYDFSAPKWRGIIRQDGSPWYVCMHSNHKKQSDAKACSAAALPAIKARDHKDPDAPLPEGWFVYIREYHTPQ